MTMPKVYHRHGNSKQYLLLKRDQVNPEKFNVLARDTSRNIAEYLGISLSHFRQIVLRKSVHKNVYKIERE